MPRPRKPPPHISRYGAPALFLLAVTIAVLLIRAGLGGSKTTTTTAQIGTTQPTRATTTTHTAKPSKRFYRVAAGDTFGSIALKAGISISELERLNPGVSSNSLQVGQMLRVK